MTNPFTQFEVKERKVFIEALNAEVVLKDLSLADKAEITSTLISGTDDKGEAIVDVKAALGVKYVKISKALVNPKMSPEALRALSGDAEEAINELLYLVDPQAAEAEAAALAEAEGKKSLSASGK